ncbi:MOSC domain-containing protein [Streptomyces sp. NPDC004111]|uniref:MOSC domain-containing protein n=1 Tax=Streptomyces sp. NPDC004111 TaxID=3364690 RepID=UPI0036934FCE
MELLSVNLGRATASEHTDNPSGMTGIGKIPAQGPVEVREPGPSGTGGSGLVGDDVCDLRHHGGTRQAVYAYAREDLDRWEEELGRPLRSGEFGENFTTAGLDVNEARLGERWRVGADLVLEVTASRIPCRTFAGALDEKQWVKRFTQAVVPGAYLRVVEPGAVRAGDPIEVVHRPSHEVTVAMHFQAYTLRRELLPRLLEAGDVLSPYTREKALAYLEQQGGTAEK